MRPLIRNCVAAGLTALMVGSALAQPVTEAAAVLTVTDRSAPAGKALELKLADLERLPQHSFSTNTPWTRGALKYTGPLLRDVLSLAKAGGTLIRAVALNDYQVSIPVEDALKYDVIVALRVDGKPIPVRERGPLFVIYPFDSDRELQSKRYHERAISQLNSIQVE
jgi:hypothetical protein